MLRPRLLAALLLGIAVCAGAGVAQAQQVKPASPVAVTRAVYHFDSGLDQSLRGLRYIRNQLAADPTARIAVVALASGVDFMLKGAKTEGGYPFSLMIEELQDQGVQFKICNNTLESRHIPHERIVDDVEIVTSGVAELARLQSQEGYAYIKP